MLTSRLAENTLHADMRNFSQWIIMYRLKFREYFPEYSGLFTMAPAVKFKQVCEEHTKTVPITAENDAEAAGEARNFIESSKEENFKRFGRKEPHEALELVKIIPLAV